MADFLWHALLAGSCIALLAGPLGSFVIWQRMAYFGDTIAHSALLGAALALWWQLHLLAGVALSSVALALLLAQLQRRPGLSTDSLLGILAHGSLAIGLVVLSFADNGRVDLNSYLFGDLLAISSLDLAVIIGGSSVVALILWRFWQPLLAYTVHPAMAAVEGVNIHRCRLVLMLLIALLIVLAIKTIGALLITALLIIPAASSRPLVKSPEQMALVASLAGLVAVSGGLLMSVSLDTPAGPSIVVCATLLFSLSQLKRVAGNKASG